VETDPTRMCELPVGLTDVAVLGIDEEVDLPLLIHIQTRARRPGCCAGRCPRLRSCARLVWHKFRWSCFGRRGGQEG
jgi:hypothetical protein